MSERILSPAEVRDLLLEYLSDSGKTRQQFGLEMGYCGSYITSWVNGHRSIPEKVLKVLGVKKQVFTRYTIDLDAFL